MIYTATARTCDTCIHKDVCSYVEDFQTYQKMVDSIHVTYKGEDLPLRNISWISTPILECMNWAYARQERSIDYSYKKRERGYESDHT